MDKHIIVGVHIVNREQHAPIVQRIFTQFGEQIRTRLGLHDDVCPTNGLILLEMADTPETCEMIAAVSAINGIHKANNAGSCGSFYTAPLRCRLTIPCSASTRIFPRLRKLMDSALRFVEFWGCVDGGELLVSHPFPMEA